MLRPFLKTGGTRFLGMTPNGEIAGPDVRIMPLARISSIGPVAITQMLAGEREFLATMNAKIGKITGSEPWHRTGSKP
jgi:hypothetical protein